MERLLILILMVVLLAGCSQSEFMDYKAQYIEEQGISDIEEIEAFEAEPYIEGSIFKGITAVSYTHLDVYKRQYKFIPFEADKIPFTFTKCIVFSLITEISFSKWFH